MPSKGNPGAGGGGEPRTGRLARGYDAGLMAAGDENSVSPKQTLGEPGGVTDGGHEGRHPHTWKV